MFRKRSSFGLPGFGLSLGFTVFYLSLMVLLPLSMVFFKSLSLSIHAFWQTATAPRVLASYKLTFGTSLVAALINVCCGLLVAWVLVRYRFPGRKLLDSLVDLPFALPTAVAGIALTAIYSGNGWIGKLLYPLGIKIAYTPAGIMMALIFIGLPFVVRSVQPVLEELAPELEEAAATMGASPFQIFKSVVFPSLRPSLLAGFSLAFARGLGEYGSVVFISGNMPFRTEIVPLLIMTKLEQFDYNGATALALVMLVTSFILMFIVNLIGGRLRSTS